MNFIRIAKRDIVSIFKNRFLRVSVIAIIIVPLLYSLLYLYAFWDPYSKLADLPVAVVNLDKGSTFDGKDVNYGKDLVDNLKNNKSVGWKFVSKEDSEAGVKGSKYYAMFVIPENFSENVLSAKEGTPKQSEITYVANEKRNFLAAQVNSKVVVEIKSELTKNIVNEYTKAAFDNLYEVKDGMQKAADGSKDLYDGTSQLNEKVPDLTNGVSKLYKGSSDLSSGLNQLGNGTNTLASSLTAAKDGAAALDAGANQLQAGLYQVGAGLTQLNSAVSKDTATSISLSTGVKSVYDGITNADPTKGLGSAVALLNTKVNTSTDPLHPSLVSGMSTAYAAYNNQIVAMIKQAQVLAANGDAANANKILLGLVQTMSTSANPSAPNYSSLNKAPTFFDAMYSLNDGITNSDPTKGLGAAIGVLNTKVNVGTDAAHPSLVAGVTAINNGVNIGSSTSPSLVSAVAQLDNAVNIGSKDQPSVLTGINQIKNGTAQLMPGMTAAAAGANELSNGTKQLSEGGNQLRDGLSTLNSNIPKLNNGVSKLYDGSKELKDKLKDGSDKMNKNLINSSNTMAEFVSQPLTIKESPVDPVKNYGTGFAPYFIPLSLWVGALLMFFVITDKVDDDIDASPASVVLGKYLSYGYIGIIQAILASAIVIVLGLRPNNVLLYFLFNIALSLVFIAIMQSLIFLLGMAGRLLSIVLLILQLTACAGTFPLEIVPKFFKVINPFMPFTYAVSGLREVIAGLNYAVFTKDVSVLLGIMIVFLLISVLFKGHADKAQEKFREAKQDINMA